MTFENILYFHWILNIVARHLASLILWRSLECDSYPWNFFWSKNEKSSKKVLKTCPKGGPKRWQCYPLIRLKRVFFQLFKFSYTSRAQKPHKQRTRTGVLLPPGKSNYTSGVRRAFYFAHTNDRALRAINGIFKRFMDYWYGNIMYLIFR